MKKESKWILTLLCVGLFFALTIFSVHATNDQAVGDDDITVRGGESETGSTAPMDSEEEELPDRIVSEPEDKRFGAPLSEPDNGGQVPNTSGSPLGGILFMAAAIALGFGLAIARNRK